MKILILKFSPIFIKYFLVCKPHKILHEKVSFCGFAVRNVFANLENHFNGEYEYVKSQKVQKVNKNHKEYYITHQYFMKKTNIKVYRSIYSKRCAGIGLSINVSCSDFIFRFYNIDHYDYERSRSFTLYVYKSCVSIEIRYIRFFVLDPGILLLLNLEILIIVSTFIQKLPDDICNLRKLVVLNISQNRLVEVPKKIGKLQKLTHINFSKNNLREIPYTISGCKHLYFLSILDNMFTAIPEIVFSFKTIEILLYDDFYFETISYEIYRIPQILFERITRLERREYFKYIAEYPHLLDTTLLEICLRRIISKHREIPLKFRNYLETKFHSIKQCCHCLNPFFDSFEEMIMMKSEIAENPSFIEKLCSKHYRDRVSKLNQLFSVLSNEFLLMLHTYTYPQPCKLFNIFSYSSPGVKNVYLVKFLQYFCRNPCRIFHSKLCRLIEFSEGYEDVDCEFCKYYASINDENAKRRFHILYWMLIRQQL